jgi:hypothetical protein
MVGIALQRVGVRHLHHDEQRHQDKAQHRGRRQSELLPAA